MSLRNVVKYLRLFMLCGVMLIPAVYLWRKQRFFLPAPLHPAHEHLADDCSNCHNISRGVNAHSCSNCKKFPKSKAGFEGFAKHHNYNGDPAVEPDLDCLECHTAEHPLQKKGKETSLTKKEKRFDNISCGTCHENLMGKGYEYSYEREQKEKPIAHIAPSIHEKHVRWRDKCDACHEVTMVSGKEELEWNCDTCHVNDGTFKRFAKHHTYSNLLCVECHTEHKGKKASLVKADANRRLKDCGMCHEQDMGKGYTYKFAEGPSLFNHVAPSIHEKHEEWKSNCRNCHDGGILNYGCTNCHDQDTNEPHVFTGFAKHHTYTELKCLSCHTEHKGPSGETTTVESTFTKTDCAPCHAREMGSQYEYKMRVSKHPEDTIHEAHEQWSGCDNCHDRGTPNEKCVNCHDSETGEEHVFEKLARHHTDSKLNCLECHTEHRGRSPESLTKRGKGYDRIECSECHHDAEMKKDIDVAQLPKDVVGDAGTFSHLQHRVSPGTRDCEVCHEHREKGTHNLADYSVSCTECHHTGQDIPCKKCHPEEDRFYKGIVPDTLLKSMPDQMSGVVGCEKCHEFDEARRTFERVRDKCVECHTDDYGDLADYWKGYIESEVDGLADELAKLTKSDADSDFVASIERNLRLVKTQGMHNWEVSRILITKLRAQIRSIRSEAHNAGHAWGGQRDN